MSKFGYISCDQCDNKLYKTKKKIKQGANIRLSEMVPVSKTPKFERIAEIKCSCGSISFKLVRE